MTAPNKKTADFKAGDVCPETGRVFIERRRDGWVHWAKNAEHFQKYKLRKSKNARRLRAKLKEAFKNHPRKYRRGDTCAETGRVFWGYCSSVKGFESWNTREVFEAKLAAQTARREQLAKKFSEHPRIYRKGDIHPVTKKVFWAYCLTASGFECWYSREVFEEKQAAAKSAARAKREQLQEAYDAHPRIHRLGDVCEETGKIFWSYNIACPGFEDWLSTEVFERRQELMKERRAEQAVPSSERKYRLGDSHPQDPTLKFLQYSSCYVGGEQWVPADQFALLATARRCRSRARDAFKKGGFGPKAKRTQELLGCDWPTLHAHIESQFTDGMSWERFDEIHIDHKIPLASATTEEELEALCHYTNLQPLWAADNMSKGARMPEDI